MSCVELSEEKETFDGARLFGKYIS